MADPHKEFLRKLQATFRSEAEEHLQEIVSNVVLLEQAGKGTQADLLQRALKTLHTLKGAARAVDLTDLEALCHAMEDVFSVAHQTGVMLSPAQFDTIHQACNIMRQLVNEPSGRNRNQALMLISRLDRLSADINATGANEASPQADTLKTNTVQPLISDIDEDSTAVVDMPDIAKTDVIRIQGKHLDAIRYQAEALLSVELSLQHHVNDLLELAEEMADQRERVHITESVAPHLAPFQKSAMAAKSTRVRDATQRLNDDLKGREAELAGDDIKFEVRCRRLVDALSRTHQHFAAIRSRLMEATLEAALVPFASALDQLPGLVRNLARNHGKEAILNIHGESIQIDRRILDLIREALIHLVTNAVDHGIEPMEKRRAAGKPPAGEIRIEVRQRSSNQVAVTIADDGAGIDVASLVNAAIKNGSVNANQLAGIDKLQTLQLMLHAGVSTSEKVTQVSGRGMGMAIVAEKIVSAGGDLLIENSSGKGCTFELLLPVRLATLRGLVVHAGKSRYVFPLSGIEAVRTLKAGDIRTVENRKTLLVEQRVLPIIRLDQLLGLRRSAAPRDADEGVAVIARVGGVVFAIHVDEIVSEQEVLPKSLGKQLRKVRCITGATQLGDGSLVPILGLEDIAKYGLTTGDGAGAMVREQPAPTRTKRVLVVDDSITSRLLLKHVLEGNGYRVETAVDGLDALSKLRHDDFDAVVSDVEMPQMDGLALTESIRGNLQTKEMPVVLVTSLQSPEQKERGLRAGADAYVVKGSFDQDNLLATIRRLI